MIGSLYFIQEGPGGAIKIGWTGNCVQRRLINLQIGNSNELVLLATIPDVPISEEGAWHVHFGPHKKRSEWFHPSPDLLEAIAARAVPAQAAAPKPEPVMGPARQSLEDWLKTSGVGLTRFAERIGVSRQALHRYRTGERMPDRAIMAKIAQETDGAVRPNDFYEGQAA